MSAPNQSRQQNKSLPRSGYVPGVTDQRPPLPKPRLTGNSTYANPNPNYAAPQGGRTAPVNRGGYAAQNPSAGGGGRPNSAYTAVPPGQNPRGPGSQNSAYNGAPSPGGSAPPPYNSPGGTNFPRVSGANSQAAYPTLAQNQAAAQQTAGGGGIPSQAYAAPEQAHNAGPSPTAGAGPGMGGPPMGGPPMGGPQMGSPQVGSPQMGGPPMGGPQMGGLQMGGPPMGGPPMGAPMGGPPMYDPAMGGPPMMSPMGGLMPMAAPMPPMYPMAAPMVVAAPVMMVQPCGGLFCANPLCMNHPF